MDNTNQHYINRIQEQKKLKKITKHDTQYTKISTSDEGTFDAIELQIEKEIPITSTSVSPTFNSSIDDFKSANPISIEKNHNYFYKKLGNTFSFFGDRDGNPVFIIGPHWPMYFCFCSFISGGIYLFFYAFWSYLHIIFKILGVFIYCLFFGSYTYTFLINPGYPKHDLASKTGEPRNKYRFCERCKMWVNLDKKPNHCFDCDICIEGYDHHCPWTSKCIGRKNLTTFYIFVITTLFIFAYVVCALTNAQAKRTNLSY